MADFVIANASEAVHAAARRDVDRVSKSSDVILRHEHLRASKDDRARGLSFEAVATRRHLRMTAECMAEFSA